MPRLPSHSARTVKYYNPVSNLCAIRCSRDEYRQVRVPAAHPNGLPPLLAGWVARPLNCTLA